MHTELANSVNVPDDEATVAASMADQVVEMHKAIDLLCHELERSTEGVISSTALARVLRDNGIEEPQTIINYLKVYDFDYASAKGHTPPLKWYRSGRSFLTERAFDREREERDLLATKGVAQSMAPPEAEGNQQNQVRRAEETRIGYYVKEALEDIYSSDICPERKGYQFVFDVHSQRAGSEFENVDLLAVDWRREDLVELITVEVKLDFTPKLIQQAHQYTRFSHRVWIAVAIPQEADLQEAASWLRTENRMLFETTIHYGLGILACRRGRGRCYDVRAVQWPRLQAPDRVEFHGFLDRYRMCFEAANVLRPQGYSMIPPLSP